MFSQLFLGFPQKPKGPVLDPLLLLWVCRSASQLPSYECVIAIPMAIPTVSALAVPFGTPRLRSYYISLQLFPWFLVSSFARGSAVPRLLAILAISRVDFAAPKLLATAMAISMATPLVVSMAICSFEVTSHSNATLVAIPMLSSMAFPMSLPLSSPRL